MKKTFDLSLFKFLFIGFCNTLLGCGIMFLLYNLAGCSYWFSSATNYVVVSVVSFFTHKFFTFRNYERSWGQVSRFIITVLVCYVIAYGVAKPVAFYLIAGKSVAFQENVAMLAGMGIYTVLNYTGQRFFTFRCKN